MDKSQIIWLIAFSLTFIIGFVARRTTVCAVKSVHQILYKRRASILIGFAKIIIWVFATTILLEKGFNLSSLSKNYFTFDLFTFCGGLLFGFGAVLNCGCSLHTLIKLGSGDFSMAISLLGFSVGAILFKVIQPIAPELSPTRTTSPFSLEQTHETLLMIALALWVLWELYKLFRNTRIASWKVRLLAPTYNISSAAAIFGISNGILFFLVGSWTYTFTLSQMVTHLIFPNYQIAPVSPMLWWLLLMILAGILLSASTRDKFKLKIKPRLSWINQFIGGLLMGLGAALIPGGNDVLLLNGIPGLSPHAAPAFLAMLLGIAIALLVKNSRK